MPPPAPFLILHPLSELVSLYSARSMSCGRAIAVLAKFASTFQSTPGEDQTEAKKQKQCHHKSRGLCHPGRNGRTKLYNTENPTWPDSSPTLSRLPAQLQLLFSTDITIWSIPCTAGAGRPARTSTSFVPSSMAGGGPFGDRPVRAGR